MWAREQIRPLDYKPLLRDARDYALLHGLVIRNNRETNDNVVNQIPLTLFPTPFPRELYQECLDIQPSINTLMSRLANDSDFMEQTLRPIAQVDEFTSHLLDINRSILREGRAQPLSFCISRTDYMLDQVQDASLRVRQVEVNMIASSMSAHSYNLKSLHDFLCKKYNVRIPGRVPDNGSINLVAQGIIDAFDAYNISSAHVLLVGEERSLNFSDQHLIETCVHQSRPDIKILRRRFADLVQIVQLGPNKELLLEDSREIGLVYFRHGYDPSDYNFEGAWEVRLLLERSRAIKCPSIDYHLSGAKKFQQVLNSTQALERYLDTDSARRVANVFCKFWSLDCDDLKSSEQYQLLSKDSCKLVLKPQREGGGHNIFGDKIRPFVDGIQNSADLSQYILMEYIDSPQDRNWLLLHQDIDNDQRLNQPDRLVSELGIFGSVLSEDVRELTNKTSGYLVRNKKFGVDEGGVAMGYAGIGNIFLIECRESKNYY